MGSCKETVGQANRNHERKGREEKEDGKEKVDK